MAINSPALSQESRYEPATVIPLKQEDSLLNWLIAEGRLIARPDAEEEDKDETDPEIEDLMEVDDKDFDDDVNNNDDLDD
ncbi:DUF3134 family protein [Spirulina sp. CS-785/01]|uniref:DUF3134 family protein n=1 Tax=Spirulina sp. CS-785/01 TaxID=3021716 RepID=UPI00232C76CF|nr:DUF3134 family protein [Spirulina sp. CS-785/01]MDB9314604.1 DUF3134 family protein [Spirulina sp. CS-785/01]